MKSSGAPDSRLILLTLTALICFAGNSVLGRAGLLSGTIGPGTFSLIRILSGAACLVILARLIPPRMPDMARSAKSGTLQGDWRGAIALLVYVVFFSFAYLALDAGLGALILFFLVQITMVGTAWVKGERLAVIQWAGLILSLAALGFLLWPARGMAPVSVPAAASMAIAGVAWGTYSLIGRHARDPLRATAGNFARASFLAAALYGLQWMIRPEGLPGLRGIVLAIASGALTSGLGYAVWYGVAPRLSAVSAGVAQLCVPVIVAAGGFLFLGETLSLHETLAGAGVLIGVWLAVDPRLRPARR